MAIVRTLTHWTNAKVGEVLQPTPDTFVRIAALEWDGTIWDIHGCPWRSISGNVVVMRPDNAASAEYLSVMMHGYERKRPTISIVDINGNSLLAMRDGFSKRPT